MTFDEAGLSAAEAALLNNARDFHNHREQAVPVVQEIITAYFEAVEPRNRLREPHDTGVIQGTIHKFEIGGVEGYIISNCYPDGRLGEIFLQGVGKEGSTVTGLMNLVAILISVALQYGVPLEQMTRFMRGMDFEPKGMTTDPEIPQATSLPDYIARYLEARYGDRSTGK